MVSIDSGLPQDIQDGYSVRFFAGENAGYLMLGVTSELVSPEEIYAQLISNVESSLELVDDVDIVEIFNIEELDAYCYRNRRGIKYYSTPGNCSFRWPYDIHIVYFLCCTQYS
jgi:hypothetical protein